MTIWIDNQISPTLAGWLRSTYSVDGVAVRDLGLQSSADIEISGSASGVTMKYDVIEARYVRDYIVWVRFRDGVRGKICVL